MNFKNTIPLVITLLIVIPALYLGKIRYDELPAKAPETVMTETNDPIPHIGEIEILNGCGVRGIARRFSGFLRKNNFDVKKTDGAKSYNYRKTLVISRKPEMEIAQQLADVLDVRKAIFIRTDNSLYDATVIIGHDYGDLNYGQ